MKADKIKALYSTITMPDDRKAAVERRLSDYFAHNDSTAYDGTVLSPTSEYRPAAKRHGWLRLAVGIAASAAAVAVTVGGIWLWRQSVPVNPDSSLLAEETADTAETDIHNDDIPDTIDVGVLDFSIDTAAFTDIFEPHFFGVWTLDGEKPSELTSLSLTYTKSWFRSDDIRCGGFAEDENAYYIMSLSPDALGNYDESKIFAVRKRAPDKLYVIRRSSFDGGYYWNNAHLYTLPAGYEGYTADEDAVSGEISLLGIMKLCGQYCDAYGDTGLLDYLLNLKKDRSYYVAASDGTVYTFPQYSVTAFGLTNGKDYYITSEQNRIVLTTRLVPEDFNVFAANAEMGAVYEGIPCSFQLDIRYDEDGWSIAGAQEWERWDSESVDKASPLESEKLFPTRLTRYLEHNGYDVLPIEVEYLSNENGCYALRRVGEAPDGGSAPAEVYHYDPSNDEYTLLAVMQYPAFALLDNGSLALVGAGFAGCGSNAVYVPADNTLETAVMFSGNKTTAVYSGFTPRFDHRLTAVNRFIVLEYEIGYYSDMLYYVLDSETLRPISEVYTGEGEEYAGNSFIADDSGITIVSDGVTTFYG